MSRRRHRSDESPVSFFSFQDIIASVTAIMIMITLMLSVELASRHGEGQAAPPAPAASSGDQRQKLDELEGLKKRLAEVTQVLEQASALPQVSKQQLHELEDNVAAMQVSENDIETQRPELQKESVTLDAELAAGRAKLRELEAKVREINARNSTDGPRVTLLGNTPGAGGKTPILLEVDATELTAGRMGPDHKPQMIQRFEGADALVNLKAWLRGRKPREEYFVLLVRPGGVGRFQDLRTLLATARFDVGWDVWPASKMLFTAAAHDTQDSPAATTTPAPGTPGSPAPANP